MKVVTLRRWLQPSPTLRWHPWAPITAILLAFLFTFAIGARFGYRGAKVAEWEALVSDADMARFRNLPRNDHDAISVMADANIIDNTVRRWSRRNSMSVFERQLESLDLAMIGNHWIGRDRVSSDRSRVAALAEFRLSNLSGQAPAWKASAGYCRSYYGPVKPTDVRELYADIARLYSELLGRDVAAEQLAPVVPGWLCEGRSVQQAGE